MEGLFLSTFVLGLVFSASPGAVNAEALRRGLARGFWPALLVQVGSLVGDTIWAIAALTGTALLVQNGSVRFALGLAGALFLFRLAWSAYRDAWLGSAPERRDVPAHNDFITGTLFSLTNPFALAFWLGMGGGIVATTTAHAHLDAYLTFLAGFDLGALLWCAGSAAAIAWGRRYAGNAFFRGLNALCGAALTYFGVRVLWRTLRALRFLRLVLG